jgi:hypothetical protein
MSLFHHVFACALFPEIVSTCVEQSTRLYSSLCAVSLWSSVHLFSVYYDWFWLLWCIFPLDPHAWSLLASTTSPFPSALSFFPFICRQWPDIPSVGSQIHTNKKRHIVCFKALMPPWSTRIVPPTPRPPPLRIIFFTSPFSSSVFLLGLYFD